MNFVVSVLLDPELGRVLGKKGSENSIIYYNGVYSGNHITALAPGSVEDKIHALCECIMLSDAVIVSTKKVDKYMAEALLACSTTKKRVILTSHNDISDLTKGISISGEIVAEQENLQSIITEMRPERGGPTRVDIDKSFTVKGVGAVLLGIVTSGSVSVHDKLILSSSGKEVTIRSIQSNDVDVQIAEGGTRVGLAVKGIDGAEAEKGDLLTKEKKAPSAEIEAEINTIKIHPEEIAIGKAYLFVSNFSYTTAYVKAFNGNTISLKLDKALSVREGDYMMLARTQVPRVFASGSIKSAK